MIQRVQSIFLLAITIAMIAALFVPLVQLQIGDEVVSMTAFSVDKGGETIIQTFWIAIDLVLVAAISIFSIFQFNNRLLQIKLGALISFMIAAGVGLILFLKGDYPAKFDVGIWIVMASLIFNFFANWFIRRDEKLIQDSNRLR